MANTNWTDAQTPANASYTEPSINSASYSEAGINTATWSRNSGIDTSIALYDDATISYDDTAIYYDDFDASTITTDDVHFSTITDGANPATTAWTDAT